MRRRLAASGLVTFLLAGCAGHAPEPSRAPAPAVVAPSVPTAAARIAAAQVGVPYHFGGASPAGFDCSGLVWYAYHEAGLSLPRTAAEQRAAVRPVDADALQPGDLVFFKTPADHVGVYVGAGEFVHAPSTGKAVERSSLHAPYYLLGFAGAGRLPP